MHKESTCNFNLQLPFTLNLLDCLVVPFILSLCVHLPMQWPPSGICQAVVLLAHAVHSHTHPNCSANTAANKIKPNTVTAVFFIRIVT